MNTHGEIKDVVFHNSPNLKKFCLFYLLKKEKKKISKCSHFTHKLNDFFNKDSEKKKKIKSSVKAFCFIKDCSEFSLLFRKFLNFFSEKKKIQEKNLSLNEQIRENYKFFNFLGKKKNIYLNKNFRKTKERNFLWFFEIKKSRYFRRILKTGNNSSFLNPKVLLNLVSKELQKNSILGFSKKAIEFIFKTIDEFVKNIIIEMGKISFKRKLARKKVFNIWGNNNLIRKKIKTYKEIRLKIKFMSNLKTSVRKFKVKKKLMEISYRRNGYENKNVKDNDRLVDFKKISEPEDVLLRANKTLMTLLTEILQARTEELKKATSCLCQYKPTEIKQLVKKEEEILVAGTKLEFKKKSLKGTDLTKYFPRSSPSFFNSFGYLSGIDCFFFIKKNENLDNKGFLMALLTILMADFNLRIQNKNFKL